MEQSIIVEEAESERSNIATICATVTSGFEYLAIQECNEKIGTNACARTVKKFRGRILFDLPYNEIEKASQLRSVDNLSVLVGYIKDVDLSIEKDEAVGNLCRTIEASNWKLALDTWRLFTKSDFCLDPLPESSPPAESAENLAESSASVTVAGGAGRPTFRVTCTRTGDGHQFSSRDVAPAVGSMVNERFGWPVKMKGYDVEVVVNVLEASALAALSLTAESMHRRNIAHFGLTTLKSTIAYCMLRMAQPKPGEIICDPMCGVGSIPLEGLIDWKLCCVLAGDLHDVPVERTRANYDSLVDRRKNENVIRPDLENDVCQWDVTNLPLKSSSVDVFVTDLPFGKRMGSRRNNWSLYHKALEEMARVCRPGGRAVLLTQDKKCMVQTLQRCNHLWRKKNFIFINHGGLRACVYLIQRAKPKNRTKGGRAGEGRSGDGVDKEDVEQNEAEDQEEENMGDDDGQNEED